MRGWNEQLVREVLLPRVVDTEQQEKVPTEALRAASASTGVPNGNASDVAIGKIWAESEIFDRTCEVTQNETGRFVGTMFTARDNLAVADALGEDLFNYWGISYGTVLGATVAGRFPERVGRMVLDGVLNSHEYYTNTESEIWDDTASQCQPLMHSA